MKTRTMLIQINMRDDVPIYEQLRREIIKGILTGALEPGEVLPSVRNMAESLSINMHTVSKTYNILKTEGFLILEKGNRAIVNSREMLDADERFKAQLDKEVERLMIEAKCRGMDKAQLLKMVEQKFDLY